MKTLSEYFKRDSAYWGESSDWLVAATTTRDADCLGRSNWRSFLKLLGGTGAEGAKGTQDVIDGVRIEEANHWACRVGSVSCDPPGYDRVNRDSRANH